MMGKSSFVDYWSGITSAHFQGKSRARIVPEQEVGTETLE